MTASLTSSDLPSLDAAPFITRADAAQRYGCYESRMVLTFMRKGYPFPKGFRAALKVGDEIWQARNQGELHAQIMDRVQPFGQQIIEGFTYDRAHGATVSDE